MATLKVPYPVPSPTEDAENLRKACQGWGTDEKAVIEILAHRNAAQRKQIMLVYEKLYKENLMKRLESELTGDLEKAVCRWMYDPIDRQAVLANLALKNTVDYQTIVEIACNNPPMELFAVKRAYQTRYKRSLEEDVASHTTGDFRKILVALVGTYRYNGEEINTSLAQSEAKILHDAISQKALNHEDVIRVVTTRSKAQLRATFNKYKDEYGTCITKDTASGSRDEFILAFRITIHCIISPLIYYEKVLRHSVDESGPDEDTLTRVIVTRAEKDLNVIKEMFRRGKNVTLEQAVSKETSGHYKSFILALIGN